MSSSFTTTTKEKEEEEEKKEFIDALFSSARYGDVEDIKTILNHGIVSNFGRKVDDDEEKNTQVNNFVNFQDENGRTALFYACANGHTDAVEVLVNEFNANIMKTTNTDESTCLHWACLNGHQEVVKFLLQKGGKTLAFKVNKNGRTPMDEAMHNDRQECVKVIMYLTCDDDDENDG